MNTHTFHPHPTNRPRHWCPYCIFAEIKENDAVKWLSKKTCKAYMDQSERCGNGRCGYFTDTESKPTH